MRKLFWLIPFLCIACKSRVNGSDLKHTFGHTRRAPAADIRDCRGKTLAELRPGASTEMPEASDYVRRIAQQIMQSNPDTFKDVYAPEQICLFVTTSKALNAEASHEWRTVIFHSGLLQIADNDATVASVVAHELAHISMQHTHASEYEQLLNHPEWQKKGVRLEQQLKDLQTKVDAAWEKKNQLTHRVDAINEELDKKASTDLRNQRKKLQEQESAIQSDLFAQYDEPTLSLETAMYYQQVLRSVYSATTRQLPDQEDAAILSQTFEDKALNDMMARVTAHNKAVDALNVLEQKKLPKEWQELSSTLVALNETRQQIESTYLEISTKRDEIKTFKESLVGDALYNWVEEEADDVGLEFYLRAGWSPVFYSEIFRKQSLISSEDSASCRAQLSAEVEPNRGIEFHPSDCWRLYNATIQEMKEHKTPYEDFIKKATRQVLEEGRLQQLKAQLAPKNNPL